MGPYAALASVGLGVAGQLAANHGSPLGKMLGGKHPEELIAEFEKSETPDESAAHHQV
jgi:hypothetical protein